MLSTASSQLLSSANFILATTQKKNSLSDVGHWDEAVGFQLQTLSPLGYSARAVHKSKLLRKLLAKNLARNTT